MIKKIVLFSFTALALLSLMLALNGVTSSTDFAIPFRAFMVNCNRDFAGFKISIPYIPEIPQDFIRDLEVGSGGNIFDAFNNFVRGFFDFINFVIRFLNVIVILLNVIIHLIQFILVVIKNIFTLRDIIVSL